MVERSKLFSITRLCTLLILLVLLTVHIPKSESTGDTFRVWLFTDPHIGEDSYGYDNKYVLEDALQDSENDWDFNWDIAFILGDLTRGGKIGEYQKFIDAFTTLTNHDRESFYMIPGNHDINGGIQNYRRYIDMLGKNTEYSGVDNEKRPYYIENISDDMDGYTIRVGNTIFIAMAPSWGNKEYYDYSWWENIVNSVPDNINIICLSHHYVDGSGIQAIDVCKGMENSNSFANWMNNHRGRIDGWFCGHIHWEYDDSRKIFVSSRWNTLFMCASALDDGETLYTASKSIVLTFTEGSSTVQVDDYYHGLSTFNYHDGEEQWDNEDPTRGRQSFNLNNPFSLSPEVIIPPPLDTIFILNGPHEWNQTTLQITSNTAITFTVADYNDTLKETRYKIDDGEWKVYTNPFTISEQGMHKLYYYSINTHDIQEEVQVEQIEVTTFYEADELSPLTIETIYPPLPDGKNGTYKSNVTITLTASDSGTGVNATYYSFDGLNWSKYIAPITIHENGIHYLFFYSIDNSNNEEEITSIIIKIDKTYQEKGIDFLLILLVISVILALLILVLYRHFTTRKH